MEVYTGFEAVQLDLFASRLPARPLATDDWNQGTYREPRASALLRRYVQPNPRNLHSFLVLDIDRAGAAFAWDEAGLPHPTWAASNPVNAHAHLGWALHTPVSTSEMAHLKPLRYLAGIEAGYRDACRADRSYTGTLTKNPAHAHWRVLWGRAEPFELDELRDYLPDELPRLEKRPKQASGVGRNVALFDRLRYWAYRARRSAQSFDRWRLECRARAEVFNCEFLEPLDVAEVKAVALSVARWTWSRTTAEGFSAYQSNAGQRRKTKQRNQTQQMLLTELGI